MSPQPNDKPSLLADLIGNASTAQKIKRNRRRAPQIIKRKVVDARQPYGGKYRQPKAVSRRTILP